MSRALTSPRALARHLLVAATVVACVALGQWQLDRLAEVRELNQRLEDRLGADAVAMAALPWADAGSSSTLEMDELEFVRVEATGVWRVDDEVLQRNREYRTASGFHLLTPLDLGDGRALLVRRGWVPATFDEPPVDEARPPDGPVTVTGVLERPVPQPSFGPQDPEEGILRRVFHTDTRRLNDQIDGELYPMVLRLESQQPPPDADAELPLTIEPPVLDEANHRSYAVQWHLFAVIATVGYGAWLRQSVRRG